jgi:putative serine protease PepD
MRNRTIRRVGTLLLSSLVGAVSVSHVSASDARASAGVASQSHSNARPKVPSPVRRVAGSTPVYSKTSDMVAAVFPSLLKIVGSVGDRKVNGGSGFVISPDGLVVTNHHVIAALLGYGAGEILAVFDNGRVVPLKFIASDAEADIAVCAIAVERLGSDKGAPFPFLRFASSSSLRPGDPVAVMGAPLGGSLVPALGALGGDRFVADDENMNQILRGRSDWALLQIDAPMSSGCSGGPIVDADGHVVGVSVMVQTSGGLGVGAAHFGVAGDQVRPIVDALLAEGRVTRPSIGLTTVVVDSYMAAKGTAESGVEILPPGSVAGLLVTRAAPGGPAAVAGVREGDIITHVQGLPASRIGDLFRALGPVYEPGKVLQLALWRPRAAGRGGQSLAVTIQPSKRQDSPGPFQRRFLN